jgi:cytochrome P450
VNNEILDYPMFRDHALDVNERYKEIQKKGLIKVRLPYGAPTWLATRYQDARMIFGDHRFSRTMSITRDEAGLMPSSVRRDPSLLLNQDPPNHTRMRRLVANPFTPGHVSELQSWVQEIVDELANDLAAAGSPADFVTVFSQNLSFRVLVGILGIPQDKGSDFRNWVDIASALDTDPQTRADATARTHAFIKERVAEKRVRLSEDLMSALVQAHDEGQHLDEAELVSLVLQFWIGGFKTVFWQLGMILYTLMTQRRHWEALLDNPKLVLTALEELWRWIPSFKYGAIFARWAKEDVEFSDGTVVRAGESVLPELAVANRDESVFPHGWEVDFHRVEPQPHLAFTHGAHKCIGQHLARLQVRLTLETLLRRFPTLALAVPAEDIKWSPSTMLRSVEALPLKW